MAKHRKLHFEDQGQDFLWWQINEQGTVVDCGPFQASVWVGSQVIDDSEAGLTEGDCPLFFFKDGEEMQLKYQIERIEEMEVADAG